MKSYEKFLDDSQQAIIVVGRFGAVIAANKQANALLKNSGGIVGHNVFEVLAQSLNGFSLRSVIPLIDGGIIYLEASQLISGISAMVHQLRSPLTALKWTVEDMLEDVSLNSRQEQGLQNLHRTTQFLINLVNELLNVHKLETGTFKTNPVLSDLVRLVGAIVDILKPAAQKSRQSFIIKQECEIKPVILDQSLFNLTCQSLLENAINYAAPDTTITITFSCDEQKKRYIVAVNNRGSIISEEDKPRLFQKFYRGEIGRKIKPTGSGLGLYIAELAAKANGGELWFESSMEEGVTFYMGTPMR